MAEQMTEQAAGREVMRLVAAVTQARAALAVADAAMIAASEAHTTASNAHFQAVRDLQAYVQQIAGADA